MAFRHPKYIGVMEVLTELGVCHNYNMGCCPMKLISTTLEPSGEARARLMGAPRKIPVFISSSSKLSPLLDIAS